MPGTFKGHHLGFGEVLKNGGRGLWRDVVRLGAVDKKAWDVARRSCDVKASEHSHLPMDHLKVDAPAQAVRSAP